MPAKPKFMRQYIIEHPPRDSTGQVPLTALGDASYQGARGGLYPEGRNEPPSAYLAQGLVRTGAVRPLAASGQPDACGAIGLLAIGLSHTHVEFEALRELASVRDDLNPALVFVNGAQPQIPADLMAAGDAGYWDRVMQAVVRAGLMAAQIQVVWLKSAIKQPRAPFPAEVVALKGYLEATVQQLVERFPSLQLVYVSSRSYGGYSEIPLSPEPHAYESGFAVKWLIEAQINMHTTASGSRPWVGWGPYLWADGTRPRAGDGLHYVREDFGWDGVHLSVQGAAKVGRRLLAHFVDDPTSRPWFVTTPSHGHG